MWIDNFEGERPEAEDVDTATLQEIRRKTLAELADPHSVTPKFIWHNQIRAIDEELEWREGDGAQYQPENQEDEDNWLSKPEGLGI